MLSLAKLKPGQQQYYLDTVARGTEEYYTGAKEAPGQWLGRGAESLGLEGIVDEEALHRVLSHRDPSGGTRLTRAQGAPKVPGYDGVFNDAKSVSLLFALGPPEVSNEVRNAQDAAVGAAFAFLQGVAARARRGKGGVEQVAAEGLVGAAFRHRTSRAGDPHLHTHVLVANLVRSPNDGRWSALDGRPLYGWARPTGFLHEAQLRAELTRRLGVEWGPIRKGIAEIAGIPPATLRAFSRRRVEIEAKLDEWGQRSPAAAQEATRQTRTPKVLEGTAEGLLPEWRRRAEGLGLDAYAIAALVGNRREVHVPVLGSAEADELFASLASPQGLTAKASTFGRREVLQAICSALPDGGDIPDIVALAEAFLRSEHVLALDRPSVLRSSDVIRRADGRVVPSYADETRFTTPEMLAVERDLLGSALRRRDEGAAVVDSVVARRVMATRPTLSAEQRRVVWKLCRSGDGVDAVEGVAGAGKTFSLGAARDAWEAAGHRVIGCALAARAAKELERGSGIRSSTLDRLLRDLDSHEAGGLGHGTIVVCDEAAMVGTRKLARLLAHAEAGDAKVVLVGDRHQLPAIDAGGAFAGIADRLGVSRLDDNRRQTAEWERQALAELRAGDLDRAVEAYVRHDRVHDANDADALRDRLAADWWAARMAGQPALMIATRHREVDELNRRARTLLRQHGAIGEELMIGDLPFAVGDEVLALRNDYRLGVLNGTRATIEALDRRARTMTATTARAERLLLPWDYVEAGHLTHAYASTVHKSQGATVERALVLGDDALAREPAYSGLSRGVSRNDLYVLGAPERREDHHVPGAADDSWHELLAAIDRTLAQRLATDQLPSSRLLAAEKRGLERQLRHAPPDRSGELQALADERRRLEGRLADLARRQANVEAGLDGLRGIRRLTRLDERHNAKRWLENLRAHKPKLRATLDDVTRHERELRRAQDVHDDWADRHRPELDRLRMIERLEWFEAHPPTRIVEPSRGAEHDLGLGLEL